MADRLDIVPVRIADEGAVVGGWYAGLALGACESSGWSQQCRTDLGKRSCDISMSGTQFHELPFPVSGPMGGVPDRFSLTEATPGGSATFSAGGTEGGTFTCEQGQTVQVADSTIECTEIGDTSLEFTITRLR